MSDWLIRNERPGEEAAIAELTSLAFSGVPYADGNETEIIALLRDQGALALSLVAISGGLIGHAAFSPVQIGKAGAGWYGLGPISVLPERQRSGVGTALVLEGLGRLKALGAKGCVVLGDPAYYAPLGFEWNPALTYAEGPPEAFRQIVFSGDTPQGEAIFHPAFYPS